MPFENFLIAAAITLAVLSPMTGSFLKCWADRARAGQSVADGRSYCDVCGKTLGARDLIPILSWLWQGGRSRCCGVPISPTLLAAEVVAAALAVWAFIVLERDLWLPAMLIAWGLQAAALLAAPATRTALIMSAVLSAFAILLTIRTGALIEATAAALLGACALAGIVWLRRAWVPAALLLPVAGAIGGISGLGLAICVAVIASPLHRLWTRRIAKNRAPWSASFAIGLAAGIWLVWLYAPAGGR